MIGGWMIGASVSFLLTFDLLWSGLRISVVGVVAAAGILIEACGLRLLRILRRHLVVGGQVCLRLVFYALDYGLFVLGMLLVHVRSSLPAILGTRIEPRRRSFAQSREKAAISSI